jgi:hypothetical protein
MYSRRLHPRHCVICGRSKYLCECNAAKEPKFREQSKDISPTAYTIIIHADGTDEYVATPGGVAA